MTPASATGLRTGYHHGDLRNALTQAAVGLARAGGPDAVVLREVARRTGVSAAAAYRHFTTRDALLARVKQHAAAALGEFLLESISHVPCDGDPGEVATARLRAAGEAYLGFATAHHGLFATAFCRTGHVDADGSRDGAGSVLGAPVLARLTAILDDLVAAGRMDPARRPGAEIAAWSAIHGLAVLLDGPLRAMAPTAQALARQRTLDTVVLGLTAGRDGY